MTVPNEPLKIDNVFIEECFREQIVPHTSSQELCNALQGTNCSPYIVARIVYIPTYESRLNETENILFHTSFSSLVARERH